MQTRKLIERLFVVLMLASLVVGGTAPALSQESQGQGPKDKQKIKEWYNDKIKKRRRRKRRRSRLLTGRPPPIAPQPAASRSKRGGLAGRP